MQTTTMSSVDRYVKMEKLGEGTYGVVFKAKDTVTGEVSSQALTHRILDRRFKEDQTRKRR